VIRDIGGEHDGIRWALQGEDGVAEGNALTFSEFPAEVCAGLRARPAGV
jgi:hypothetical protein